MSILGKLSRPLTKIVYGDTSIPQEFTIGLRQPQEEITVFLHGFGAPLDVTERHTMACCAPFMMGVSLDGNGNTAPPRSGGISLQFRERGGEKRVLGVIRLATKAVVPLCGSELILFDVLGSTNYCLARLRLWAHYLPAAYSNWRRFKSFDVKMRSREIRASQVAFIRPHPLMLGSVNGESGGNIFPMNLLGDLGNDYFAFALKDSRRPAHLVERLGSLAVSNVPLPLCSVAFKLATNHTKESIEWNSIPFPLTLSKNLLIPVPAAAPRVREMKVDQVHKIGSHTLFIARIISDEWHWDEPQVHIIHGFYQHWRLRGDKAKLKSSLIEDSFNKRGLAAS
jgi:flavin reductase (DIM6/NTAB) family NADH-FMN oxidoreductase RutF